MPLGVLTAGEGDRLANAIHENDAAVAAKIRKQAQLGELASQVRIVEGYYDLDTSKMSEASSDRFSPTGPNR